MLVLEDREANVWKILGLSHAFASERGHIQTLRPFQNYNANSVFDESLGGDVSGTHSVVHLPFYSYVSELRLIVLISLKGRGRTLLCKQANRGKKESRWATKPELCSGERCICRQAKLVYATPSVSKKVEFILEKTP
jgi:hypothetical protein